MPDCHGYHHDCINVPPQSLPASLREFISLHIQSVEQLEVLLLLSTAPNSRWSVRKVYDVILSTPQSVARWLDDLVHRGLIHGTPGESDDFQATHDEALREQISQLAQCYRSTPVRVIEAIYRRETSAAQSFADAFKLKNPEKP